MCYFKLSLRDFTLWENFNMNLDSVDETFVVNKMKFAMQNKRISEK